MLRATRAMLVYRTYRTIAKKVFSEFDSIIMQNLSDILPLFCTPTWSSHHVGETFSEILNFIYRLGGWGTLSSPTLRTRMNELRKAWVMRTQCESKDGFVGPSFVDRWKQAHKGKHHFKQRFRGARRQMHHYLHTKPTAKHLPLLTRSFGC